MTDPAELPLAETVYEEDEPRGPTVRDRIVVLGRRTSGKTIYLSVLYEKYWKSLDGLTMKAVSGQVHSDCVRVVDGLRGGRWPAATLETQHCDLEINYKGQRHLLVALDYAGELFRRAFVEDITDTPETRELVAHIDAAAAVMILIDAKVTTGSDVDAAIDDDFGMTQAVMRIRNWPGGKNIPVVIVLTKADENKAIITRDGGVEKFVKKRLPALARTVKRAAIFQVSAVQVDSDAQGKRVPRPNFAPWQVEMPLRWCLDQIHIQREIEQQHAFAEEQRRMREMADFAEERAARKINRVVAGIVVTMIVVATCLLLLWWTFKT
jgi:CheY-like chemotaxis protein